MSKQCNWHFNGEFFDTLCGNGHSFMADGIKENGYEFCPYCGRKIKEVRV